jgi:hypothetical protein
MVAQKSAAEQVFEVSKSLPAANGIHEVLLKVWCFTHSVPLILIVAQSLPAELKFRSESSYPLLSTSPWHCITDLNAF